MSKNKRHQQQPRLCPFKKIIERDYSGKSCKSTFNERFAPCAGERCMAFKEVVYGVTICKRIEPNR